MELILVISDLDKKLRINADTLDYMIEGVL